MTRPASVALAEITRRQPVAHHQLAALLGQPAHGIDEELCIRIPGTGFRAEAEVRPDGLVAEAKPDRQIAHLIRHEDRMPVMTMPRIDTAKITSRDVRPARKSKRER